MRRKAVRWHLWAYGRVQGVGYRAFVRRKAASLGIVGFVRNLADGRVEAVAEGPEKSLAKLRAWMEKGPRHAAVERVEVVEEPANGEFTRFSIG